VPGGGSFAPHRRREFPMQFSIDCGCTRALHS
jgi:hypothetical protein